MEAREIERRALLVKNDIVGGRTVVAMGQGREVCSWAED